MSSHAKTKKKKNFKVMSQRVKVFRSKDPLLSVLMWGVSHSVGIRFIKFCFGSFLWSSLKLELACFSAD